MKRGFTLIELLVVVLIIGILSAVALPQYQKAVNRSKAAEAWTLGKAFLDASNIYLLETGATTENLNDLPINIPTELKNWEMSTGGGVREDAGSSWINFSGKGSLEGTSLLYHFRYNGGNSIVKCVGKKPCFQMLPCTNPTYQSDFGTGAGDSYTCYDFQML